MRGTTFLWLAAVLTLSACAHAPSAPVASAVPKSVEVLSQRTAPDATQWYPQWTIQISHEAAGQFLEGECSARGDNPAGDEAVVSLREQCVAALTRGLSEAILAKGEFGLRPVGEIAWTSKESPQLLSKRFRVQLVDTPL